MLSETLTCAKGEKEGTERVKMLGPQFGLSGRIPFDGK
jgi:hypothetical protein